MIVFVINIGPEESPNISGPPGNSGKSHIQTCGKLVLETFKGRVDISGPHQSPVFLASCPGAAQQVHNLFLAFCPHSVKESFGIHGRIDISDLDVGSQMIPVVFKIINRILRLCFVQPEDLHALVVVILLCLAPYILSCFRIGGIILDGISHIGVINADTLFHPCKESFGFHLLKVFTLVVHHWPDRNHQFDSHFLQFPDHCIRIRPVSGIKSPVSLLWPVEKVYYDHVNRNPSSLILSGYFQQLLLGLIAELALPESHTIFGHHRNLSCSIGIGFLNFCRCIPRSDPIV